MVDVGASLDAGRVELRIGGVLAEDVVGNGIAAKVSIYRVVCICIFFLVQTILSSHGEYSGGGPASFG